MTDKFIVDVGSRWLEEWPNYFYRFWAHCQDTARDNGWSPMTVANYQLRPLGGRLIATRTQGWYLRWGSEASHTAFVLKWQ